MTRIFETLDVKSEILERMRLLKLDHTVREAFLRREICRSENCQMYYAAGFEAAMAEDIEQENGIMVYHIIKKGGVYYFLYLDFDSNWSFDKDDIEKSIVNVVQIPYNKMMRIAIRNDYGVLKERI